MWVPPIAMLSSGESTTSPSCRASAHDDGDAAAAAAAARREDDEDVQDPQFEGQDPVEPRLSPLLGGLAFEVPEVFEKEIIARLLDDHERAMLARTCREVRAVVLASGAPRAGAAGAGPSRQHSDERERADERREDRRNDGERREGQRRQHTLLNAKHFTSRLPLARWAIDNGMPLHWRTMEHAGGEEGKI